MSPSESIHLRWENDAKHPHRSDPQLLAPYAERSICIEVQRDQVALILRDHEVVAALLPGLHQSVGGSLETGWAAPPDRVASNSGQCPKSDAHCSLASSDSVLFLPTGNMPAICWKSDQAGAPSFGGSAATMLIDPIRFYASFLRNSEDLAAQQLEDILQCLILDAVEQWTTQRGGLEGLPLEVLADELRISIGASLAGLGLAIQNVRLHRRSNEIPTSKQPKSAAVLH